MSYKGWKFTGIQDNIAYIENPDYDFKISIYSYECDNFTNLFKMKTLIFDRIELADFRLNQDISYLIAEQIHKTTLKQD